MHLSTNHKTNLFTSFLHFAVIHLDCTDPFSATLDAVDDAIPSLNPFLTKSSGDVHLPISSDVPTFTTRTPTHEMFVGKVPLTFGFPVNVCAIFFLTYVLLLKCYNKYLGF